MFCSSKVLNRNLVFVGNSFGTEACYDGRGETTHDMLVVAVRRYTPKKGDGAGGSCSHPAFFIYVSQNSLYQASLCRCVQSAFITVRNVFVVGQMCFALEHLGNVALS